MKGSRGGWASRPCSTDIGEQLVAQLVGKLAEVANSITPEIHIRISVYYGLERSVPQAW